MVSQPYTTTGKTTALTRWTSVGKVMALSSWTLISLTLTTTSHSTLLKTTCQGFLWPPHCETQWSTVILVSDVIQWHNFHTWRNWTLRRSLSSLNATPAYFPIPALCSSFSVSSAGPICSSWLVNVECLRAGLGPLLPASLPASTLTPLEAFMPLWARWSCGTCHTKLCFVKTLQGLPTAQRLKG